jgi:hypothetical protein
MNAKDLMEQLQRGGSVPPGGSMNSSWRIDGLLKCKAALGRMGVES